MKKIYFSFYKVFTFAVVAMVMALTPSLVVGQSGTFAGGGGNIPPAGTSGLGTHTAAVSGIPAGAVITDVNVTLNGIQHTWADDLEITLIAPSGGSLLLQADDGGSNGLETGTPSFCPCTLGFDDAAANGVNSWISGTSAITIADSPFIPEGGSLDALGQAETNPNGTWTLEIFDDAGGDSGLFSSFSLFIAWALLDCEIECPADLDLDNAAGLCKSEGILVPPPTFSVDGCNQVSPVNNMGIFDPVTGGGVRQSFAVLPVVGGNPLAVGMDVMEFDMGMLCQFPMPTQCVDEICIDVTISGDWSFPATEDMVILQSDLGINFSFIVDRGTLPDCTPLEQIQVCLDAAGWDTFRANFDDGNGGCDPLAFQIDVRGTGINNFCPMDGITVDMQMPTACDDYTAKIDFADGTSETIASGDLGSPICFPVGVNTVTYCATASGTGLPLTCPFEIVVNDAEAPVLECPGDLTITLGDGECCFNYTEQVIPTDNCGFCPQAAGASAVFGRFGDVLCQNSFATFNACPGNQNSMIMRTPAPAEPSVIEEVCFVYRSLSFPNETEFIANVYCTPAPANGLFPNFTDSQPIATSGVQNTNVFEGQFMCVPVFDPAALASGNMGCPGFYDGSCAELWIEIVNTGDGSSLVQAVTTPTCNGVTSNNPVAATANTFIACANGPLFFGVVDGQAYLTASPSEGIVIPDPNAPDGYNEGFELDGTQLTAALSPGENCFQFTTTDASGNASTCDWCVTVAEQPNIATSLVCNDHVNISVDSFCMSYITADDFLEGGPYSCFYDCYEVYIKDEFGNYLQGLCTGGATKGPGGEPLGDLDASDVQPLRDVNGCEVYLPCGEYTYEVFDACRNNTCWGTFTVEDKLAPGIVDLVDVTLNCTQDTDPGEICEGTLLLAAELDGDVNADGVVDGNDVRSWDDFTGSGFGAGTPPVATTCVNVDALPPGAILTDLDIEMKLSHSWMSEVTATLISPNGTEVDLITGDCGINQNMDVVIDDENGSGLACNDCGVWFTTVVPDACDVGLTWLTKGDNTLHEDCSSCFENCAAIDGILTSDDLRTGGAGLAQFNGTTPAGVWCIEWRDNSTNGFQDNGGCVEAMSLELDYLVPAAVAPGVVGGELDGGECGVSLAYTDDFVPSECGKSVIRRTWVATDEKGNSSQAVQNIFIENLGNDRNGQDWFWPETSIDDLTNPQTGLCTSASPGIALTCGADASPMGIYEYYKGIYEGCFPCPDPSCDPTSFHDYDADFHEEYICNTARYAVPKAFPYVITKDGCAASFLDNACNIIFTYSDKEIDVCGDDCPGNQKIIRTWSALDWCETTTIEHVQIILAKDNDGPVVDMSPAPGTQNSRTITVSVNPWGCAANFTLPAPEHLSDDCGGDVTYVMSGPVPVGAGGQVNGAPKGTHTFTVLASDCCGNETEAFIIVNVVDATAPIAVALQNIVVNLTYSPTDPENGTAKLFNYQLDNGSNDGSCGPVTTVIRRLDSAEDDEIGVCDNIGGNGHNNNSTFSNFNAQAPHSNRDTDGGLFVKFCCQDLIDGDGEDLDGDGINDYVIIPVELGVWDDGNMDGVPGTPGDNFATTWGNVRLEGKLNPVLSCPGTAKITCDQDENAEAVINASLGRATAVAQCGSLNTCYVDLCGLDINQDGKIQGWVNETERPIMIFEKTFPSGLPGMCYDVNGDGVIENYALQPWEYVEEDFFNKACHVGPITRYWSAGNCDVEMDTSGMVDPPNALMCRQIIIIDNIGAPFSGSYYLLDAAGNYILDNSGRPTLNPAIYWPFSDRNALDVNDDDFDDWAEVQLDCVEDLTDPEEDVYWVTEHCSLIGWTLDSDTLNFEGDACRKIINTYTVIDWCQYNPLVDAIAPNNGDGRGNQFKVGEWKWTVIGKLVDNYPPIVASVDTMFEALPGSGGSGGYPTGFNCQAPIRVGAVATDRVNDINGDPLDNACPSEWIKWTVLVDINNDWSYDYEWSSFIIDDDPNPVPCFSDSNGNGIPDVQVGSNECDGFDNIEEDPITRRRPQATAPGQRYEIQLPAQVQADCGETQHRVEWTAYDGCGNKTTHTSYFTVQDKKAPTPYCINLSTAIMEIPAGGTADDACVELWAIDFDAGSFDNCMADDRLRFSFEDNLIPVSEGGSYDPEFRSSARKFTCADLAGGNPSTLTIPVYVWDGCGNRDFCLVNLRLTDNNGACNIPSTGSAIAGIVTTEWGQIVEEVEVMNEMMPATMMGMEMTDNTGLYMFAANDRGMDYEISATKDNDYLNGVSTLDLLKIQRHILGIELLDSPYKLIAADVNNDQKIDGLDLVELRKLILGIYTELPQNSSWRFVDAKQTLDYSNPYAFIETLEVKALASDMMDQDFIGVKIGDVNESAEPNLAANSSERSTGNVINVQFEDIQVEVGQEFEISVTADLADVYGYQFTLSTPGLQLTNIAAGSVSVTESNFGVFGDKVTTSWNTNEAVTTSGELFTLSFVSSVSGNLSDILDLNSGITRAEAYVGENLDIVKISLDDVYGTDEFALLQNEPNPFSNTTAIGFVMPEDSDATVTVYDVTGKVVFRQEGSYTKGYNEIELSKSDLGASGVHYYQLDSGDFTATKKMIVIE